MNKPAVVLGLLLAIQTWGIYGRTQSDRVVMSCVKPLGPLCFWWEPNALGRALGTSAAIEDRIEDARDQWQETFEKQVVSRFKEKDKFDAFLERFKDAAKGGLEKIGEKTEELLGQ